MTAPRRRAIMLLALLLMLPPAAVAEKRQYPGDITARCQIRVPAHKEARKKLFDRRYVSYWSVNSARSQEISIHLPKDESSCGVYLCFAREPVRIALYQGSDSAPRLELSADGIPHKYIPVSEAGDIRLVITGDAKGFALSELFVVTGKEPPEWVQRWQPPLDQADLLVLVAHPDDELLWMGGALPYYALEKGMDVAVAYMTGGNYLRRAEALNGLWTAGIRHYPYMAGFKDRNSSGPKAAMALWGGEEKVVGLVTELVRKLKPSVMLSHDLNGEYGHAAHKATARAAILAAQNGGSPDFYPDSAKEHGLWQPLKLYLHLYPEETIRMDWQLPLPSLGGRSPIQVAEEAFQMHASQKGNWQIATDGPLSASEFGLYQSLVGEDKAKDDFFENIPDRDSYSPNKNSHLPDKNSHFSDGMP